MKEVFENIRRYRMIRCGDRIVAGLSGGADSVCLLLVLKEYLEREMPGKAALLAVHVEHGIRGQESLEDAEYARSLCRSLGIPFRLFSCDVPALAGEEGLSLEEAGRLARYRCFYQAAKEMARGDAGDETAAEADLEGRVRIAVAHNQGDQAETILWNLSRGSGLAGLCGMSMVRGEVIRPLLNIPRSRIEAWLRERGIPWRTDATNLSLDYTRNRIRLEALPALARVNRRASEHIAKAGERLSEIRRYLEGEGVRWLSENGRVSREEVSFERTAFQALDRVLQDFVLYAALEALEAPRRDLGEEHMESLRLLAGRQSGRELRSLPGGLYACVRGSRYVLRPRIPGPETEAREREGTALPVPGRLTLEGWVIQTEILAVQRLRMPDQENPAILAEVRALPAETRALPAESRALPAESRALPAETRALPAESRALPAESRALPTLPAGSVKLERIVENPYTKWLDYDTINDTIVLRRRQPGDYLLIGPEGRRKKLKQYFIDEKIPQPDRNRIWLLADGSHVLWAVGHRISEGAKVRAGTKRILKVQIWEEKEDGR